MCHSQSIHGPSTNKLQCNRSIHHPSAYSFIIRVILFAILISIKLSAIINNLADYSKYEFCIVPSNFCAYMKRILMRCNVDLIRPPIWKCIWIGEGLDSKSNSFECLMLCYRTDSSNIRSINHFAFIYSYSNWTVWHLLASTCRLQVPMRSPSVEQVSSFATLTKWHHYGK